MEYCAGGSLWSQIKDNPPQSKQQVIDMLVSIASGLEHLHANGIIHRDVAARNILVSLIHHHFFFKLNNSLCFYFFCVFADHS